MVYNFWLVSMLEFSIMDSEEPSVEFDARKHFEYPNYPNSFDISILGRSEWNEIQKISEIRMLEIFKLTVLSKLFEIEIHIL